MPAICKSQNEKIQDFIENSQKTAVFFRIWFYFTLKLHKNSVKSKTFPPKIREYRKHIIMQFKTAACQIPDACAGDVKDAVPYKWSVSAAKALIVHYAL